MSRSKQGRDVNITDTSTQQDVDQTSSQSNVSTSGQRDESRRQYMPGRESWREFPRRQTTSGGTGQRYSQSSPQQTTGGYERRRGADRWATNRPDTYGYRSEYENRNISGYQNQYGNRNWSREDTGDIYSQGVRQGMSSRQYEDPYRTYDRDIQQRGYQPSGQRRDYEDYNRNRQAGGQSYQSYNQPYNREGSYRSQRGYDYDRDYDRNYRWEENRDYRSEYPNYNIDRADAAGMYGQEYGFGYPFGGTWYPGSTDVYRQQVLRCRDIMTKDMTTVTPQTTIREAADKMEDEDVGSLPVIENGRLIGIVTDRDIVCRVLAEGLNSRTTTVRDAMSEDIITCSPDETVIDAIHKMSEHQIRRLPVVDNNGRLRGIISLGDIALEAENDREIARALEHISQPTPYQSRRR